MAKGNMLLGYARGKVGDVVFKRVNGQQVTTPRNRQPRNPRSEAQTIQRLAFSSAVKTAKQLDGIVNHSFQGIEYGAKSKNYFVSKAASVIAGNIYAALDATLSAAPYRCTAAIPLDALGAGAAAPVMVSMGDLPSIVHQVFAGAISIGDGSVSGGLDVDVTVSNFPKLYGVPYDDQFTFVAGFGKEVSPGADVTFYGVEYVTRRLNFKRGLPADTVLFSVREGDALLNTDAVDADRSSAEFMSLTGDLTIAGTAIPFGADLFGMAVSTPFVAGTVIVSRYEDGMWRRSTEYLEGIPAFSPSTQADWSQRNAWNPVDELLLYSVPGDTAREEWYLNKKKV